MKLFITLITTIFIFSLYGCKKGSTSPQTEVTGAEKTKIEAQTLKEETLQEPAEESYIYNPKGRRDPFAPLIAITKEKERKSKVTGTLESYDIGDFELIGTAQKAGEYYGLLLAPDNKAYTVREGTILGLYRGKIKKITENKVVVIEYKMDYTGKLNPREIVLELYKGRGGE